MQTERKARIALLLLAVLGLAPIMSRAGEPARPTATASNSGSTAALPAHSEGDPEREARPDAKLKPAGSAMGLRGYVQTELARTYANPDHWSKMLVRTQVTAQGRLNEQVRWKLSGRLDYDAVYDVTDFYPEDVRKDQRLNFFARENFIDFTAGPLDVRLGRQQIVWGEIVGLFFADVVSAKDMREFLLPEFDILRIPQWAARAEYSGERLNAELVWIPVPSYDKIGKPGAEFFPLPQLAPAGVATTYLGETRPARTLSNTNYGARVSTLRNGWDVSGFYYRSMDATPTFYRQAVAAPQPTFAFVARHDRISQLGSTVAKDFGAVVFKAEAVYTRGRRYNVLRLADEDGVVPQNTFDWVTGLDFTLPGDSRLNVQLFQRMFGNHDPGILFKRRETGYSIYATKELAHNVEAQVLFISSIDRSDWLLRPRVVWKFEQNWRLSAGVDVFNGPPFGFFGRFANRDRGYVDVRYSF